MVLRQTRRPFLCQSTCREVHQLILQIKLENIRIYGTNINNLLNYENERFCIKLTDEHDEKKKFVIPI